MKIGKVEKLVPNLNNKRKYVEGVRSGAQTRYNLEEGALSDQVRAERLVRTLHDEEHEAQNGSQERVWEGLFQVDEQ